MVQTSNWQIDWQEPMAPPTAVWEAMSPARRAEVVASLPSSWETAPEGTRHSEPIDDSKDALRSHFERRGRSVFVAADLGVYYPDAPRFAPDLLVVLDVEPGHRSSWIVDHEGRGLDFVLEVHVQGSRDKDLVHNVSRYARLQIPEYFVYEPVPNRLTGFHLSATGVYSRLIPQHGLYPSHVLDMNLDVLEGRLRFLLDRSPLPTSRELNRQLNRAIDGLNARLEEEAARAQEEAARAQEEAARAQEEAARAQEEAARAAALEEEVERLKAQLRKMTQD